MIEVFKERSRKQHLNCDDIFEREDFRKILNAFGSHKQTAASRNIPFLFTLREWWDIWKPHWHNRGVAKDKYVMSRFGDIGPYSVENVKIQTRSENSIEGNIGYPRIKPDSWRLQPLDYSKYYYCFCKTSGKVKGRYVKQARKSDESPGQENNKQGEIE